MFLNNWGYVDLDKLLRVAIVKPSKYGHDGSVMRFRRGFMPNATLRHIASLTPAKVAGCTVLISTVDEYVETDLSYLRSLTGEFCDLLALVGVQSNQFHRALDLAAFARANGVPHAVIGGPHAMTCDTSVVHGKGVSFALAEAELVWPVILEHAIAGELAPLYGSDRRWQAELRSPVLIPPTQHELKKYVMPMVGIYPARGCPYSCNFCSVVQIAGRNVRGEDVATTIASLLAAKRAGVKIIMFTSDNFNKIKQVRELLLTMIEAGVNLPFFAQCDVQIARDEELVELMARAGCFQVFVGVEAFDRQILKDAHKLQNHPRDYKNIVELCHKHGITTHFSNIIGFPTQREGDILDHLRQLCALEPSVAGFHILTPIPGTEQYAEFLRDGLIVERNLDHFDALGATWEHPHISCSTLTDLMFRCYREFFSFRKIAREFSLSRPRHQKLIRGLALAGSTFFRYMTWRKIHPLGGGVRQVVCDSARDYSNLRRARFDLELLPLPSNLALSAYDKALNARIKM